MTDKLSSSCCHLWVCDSAGKIFVIEDVYGAVESIHSGHTVMGAPSASDFIEWKRIEGSFDKIIAGFSGIICGIVGGVRGTVLYLRRGVTHDSPLGSSWAKAFCDAVDIAVGSRCIVRKTSHGELFVTEIDKLGLATPVFLPTWNAVPSCTQFVKEYQHFVLDERDNLFVITPSGEVYGCLGLCTDVQNVKWELVAKPPFETKRRFSFFGFWRGQKDAGEMFSHVCAGSHSLWCMKKDSEELWQLVLAEVTNMDGETTLKTNWTSFHLPKDDKVLHLCADKTNLKIDALYAVDDAQKLISYTLLHDNSGRTELPVPTPWSHSWQSVAICRTQVPHIDTRNLSTPEKQPSSLSLYPKLSKEDFDICCETGDCEFCRNAEKRQLLIPSFPAGLQPVEFGEREPEQGTSQRFRKRGSSDVVGIRGGAVKKARLVQRSSSLGYSGLHLNRKRPHDELSQEGSDEEVFHTSMMYQPKRARPNYPDMARYFLVDDVKVAVKKNRIHTSKV